jgi:hypothetical protein
MRSFFFLSRSECGGGERKNLGRMPVYTVLFVVLRSSALSFLICKVLAPKPHTRTTLFAMERSGIANKFRCMRCFAKRSGAKYGRAKCNERTSYTVLSDPNDTQRSGVHESAAGGRTLFSFSFFFLAELQLLKVQNKIFSVWGGGKRGSEGVNSLRPKHLFYALFRKFFQDN